MKHTDTSTQQKKPRSQETLEFKMSRSKKTFSFNPPLNLAEEGKVLLGLTLFDYTNSVFKITNEKNSFSYTITGHWQNKSDEKPINELNRLLDLRSQNDFDLYVEQVRKS